MSWITCSECGNEIGDQHKVCLCGNPLDKGQITCKGCARQPAVGKDGYCEECYAMNKKFKQLRDEAVYDMHKVDKIIDDKYNKYNEEAHARSA